MNDTQRELRTDTTGTATLAASVLREVTEEIDTVHLTVDRNRCEGHGVCVGVAPGLLHLDDSGDLVVVVVDVPETSLDTAESAARVCPVAALRLTR